MEEEPQERPFEGGSQPVEDHPPEMPSGGWNVGQTVVIVLGILVVLAAILWVLVPFGG
ncbi:MAG TPA: hypothetical protein VFI91_07045 [Longimicrobiaceae bacterium]|nr:hypothetical protein [Longimicrobiaceae bacterium]